MDYLTNYYKNLCEQYEQQLDILKRRAQELKIGKFGRFGETGNNTYFKNPYIDDDNWNAMTPNPRPRPQQIPDYFNLKQPDKKTQTDDSKNWYKNFTNIFSKPKPKPEPEIEMYTRPSVGSKSQPETSSYVSDNVYSTQNTPLANRESQITSDMFDRMMGDRSPSYSTPVNGITPQSSEDLELANRMRQNRRNSLDRMAAGQKEITDIWNEAGERIRKIYAPKPDPSQMTPEQKSEHMARTGDSTEPVKRTTEEILNDAEKARQRLRAILDKTKPTEPQKKPEAASPTLPPDAMAAIQGMLASAAESSQRMVK